MTSVVNRGVLTVFGCDFSPIPWGNTSIYDWSHCISRNPPFQVKPSRFHTKLSILDLMNILSFSKNRFVQIWEKRILRWGNISGIKLFLDFIYFKLHGSNFPKCFLKFIHGVTGAKVTVRTFWHRADFLTALGTEYIYRKSKTNYYDQIPVNPFKKKNLLFTIKFSACSLNFFDIFSIISP